MYVIHCGIVYNLRTFQRSFSNGFHSVLLEYPNRSVHLECTTDTERDKLFHQIRFTMDKS